MLTWHSVSNRFYAIDRAGGLWPVAFAPLASNLPATPPVNTYTDRVNGAATGFYRVRVERGGL